MWLQYHQSNLTELFQAALVKLCIENVPFSGNLELDGLFCISNGDVSKQIVVKIHKVIQPTTGSQGKTRSILKINHGSADMNGLNGQKDMPVVVEVRKGKAGESLVCRSEPSNYSRNDSKECIRANKEDGTKIENAQSPTRSVGTASSSRRSLSNILNVNLDRTSPKEQEGPCGISLDAVIKVEPQQESSTGDEESIHDSFQVHDTPEMDPSKMRCKLCQKNFINFNDLETHMREVHGRYVCRQCLTTFSLSCNLRRHMKLHSGVRPHSCASCPASFSRSTDLKIHMKKHFMGKDCLSCSFCSLVFSNSYLLAVHKVKVHHSTETILKCDQCDKRFYSESHLKLHARVHKESAAVEGGCETGDLTMQNFVADEVSSFDNDNSSIVSENVYKWPSSKAILQKSLENQSADESAKEMEDGLTLDLSMDCKATGVGCSGSAKNSFADLSDRISDSYLETVKEFAPLFSLTDSDDAVRSSYGSHNIPQNSPHEAVSVGSLSTAPTSKNKRKGMPVKHVKCSENGIDDEMTDLTPCDQMVDDSVLSHDEKTLPGDSFFEHRNDSYENNKIAIKSEKEDGVFTHSSDSVLLNNNDAENRVFTCRHGGCSTSWFGFGAYEAHYVSAHCRYPCELCDQSFTSRNNRRRHANGHGNVKKHTCDRCDKLFARPDIVKEHRITHTRSYQSGRCYKCHYVCAKKTLLLSHLKRCLAAEDIDNDIAKQ